MEPAVSPPEKHLIFVATSTQEKVDRYQASADEMGLPLIFRNLKELSIFHSAAEDTGTRAGNAGQKMDEVRQIYKDACSPGTQTHKAALELARRYGAKTDVSHIHIATDDSTFTVPKDVWSPLRPKLATLVPDALLVSGEPNAQESGPGAETGPILSAAGMRNFYNMLRESALEAGYTDEKPVQIRNRTSLLLHPLSGGPIEKLEGETNVSLFAPQGLKTKLETKEIDFNNPDTWFLYSGDFVKHESAPDRAVDGALKHSAEGRHQIVEKLAGFFQMPISEKPIKSDPYIHMPAANNGSAYLNGASDLPFRLLAKKGGIAFFDFNKPHGTSPHDTYAVLKPIEDKIAASDSLVFAPLETKDDTLRIEAYLALQSAMVAKQTNPRDMNKAIIVMNKINPETGKGGWDDCIVAMIDQARKGMVKDYDPRHYGAKELKADGVNHRMTSYIDILSGEDGAKINAAALHLLNEKRKTYSKTQVEDSNSSTIVHGNPPPKNMFTVAVWTSASSDNKRLLDDLNYFGESLATNGMGLIWGGGDRHGMGSVYEGYLRGRETMPEGKTWIGGFSTPEILRSETIHGEMPHGLDYSETNPNIYERMAHMVHKDEQIKADALVVAPGGVGTSQEWLSALLIKKRMPQLMKDKPVIIYAPDLLQEGKRNLYGNETEKLFWEKSARTFLGDHYWEKLKADHHSKEGEGVYLATDKYELERIIGQLRKKKSPGLSSWKHFVTDNRTPTAGSPPLPN